MVGAAVSVETQRYLVMGVTGMDRVRGLLDRDEERRVRGTGGVCRSRGDRGEEPLDIGICHKMSVLVYSSTPSVL